MSVDRQQIDELAERLRPAYDRFLGSRPENEILLTAHSHQAWPDAARVGQLEAWDDAARLVDDKWSRVFGEVLPEFRQGVARRIGSSRPNDIAIAPNTHELVYRLSTCFPRDGTVVTTDSEFHSLSRQLRRLQEEGLEVVTVPAEAEDFASRFVAAVDEHRPHWCALSLVLFTTSRIMEGVDEVVAALAERNVPVLLDAYHAFNAIEIDANRWRGDVFVTGGGYKYAQLGEGACFMSLPANAAGYRPVSTGWFADFESLEQPGDGVAYAPGGDRFFGATFDPTPFYRAVHTFRHFDDFELTPTALRSASLARTSFFIERLDTLGILQKGIALASPRDPVCRGAFVALRSSRAAELHAGLRARGVRTDHRGDLLRFGPAPYTTSAELERASSILADCAT